MATKKKQANNLTDGQKMSIGIGVTAATLAAVGGYFLYGAKDAKKNRKKVNSWMLKAKAEVLEGIENTKELTEVEYAKLVDNVMKGYRATRSASVKDMADFAGEMKDYWGQIKKSGPSKNISMPTLKAKLKTAKKKITKKKK